MQKLIQLLYKFYHKHSTFFLFRWFAAIYWDGFVLSDIKAYYKLKKLAKKTVVGRKIKIVFICQNKQIWGIERGVFERLKEDKRFLVRILAVPEDIEKKDETIYNFFHSLYDCVIRADLKDKWYNLEQEKPDYVFYQRPYNNYLPKEYRNGEVAKYAKVCYIPYAYQIDKTTEKVCMNKLFYRNIYMSFAENSYYYKKEIKRFFISYKKGYRKILNLGYPVLEDFVKRRPQKIKQLKDKVKILWTPRWTDDETLGGSNFLKYKDAILQYSQGDSEVELTFRPHSMLYQYFVDSGKMTKEEMDAYYQCYHDTSNLHIDLEPDFTDTFWNNDIMITDFSSIIIELLLTEKPVIFCNTSKKIQFDAFTQKLIDTCYIADSWQEVMDTLKQLRAGNDKLKEKRVQTCRRLLGKDLESVTDKIVETLVNDSLGIK